MFKVGDLVIGNSKNEYGVTNRFNVCKITEIDGDIIIVDLYKPLHGKEFLSESGIVVGNMYKSGYNVNSKYFELYKRQIKEHLPTWF